MVTTTTSTAIATSSSITTTAPSRSFSAKDYPLQYLTASGLAAGINYPLWRSAAIGQSGYVVNGLSILNQRIPAFLQVYVYGFLPPYKGLLATVFGMTWARAAIFWGSDAMRESMIRRREMMMTTTTGTTSGTGMWSYLYGDTAATVLPPLLTSTLVQIINQPIVRATVTLQDPSNQLPNVWHSIRHIYKHHGMQGLWHGTSAALLKTVPKYCTAIVVKDYTGKYLDDHYKLTLDPLQRSAIKSVAAGIAGAALTNPLDVIRNEMFKTNKNMIQTYCDLVQENGYKFAVRGMGKNLIAVAMPVACTIFFTDAFVQLAEQQKK